MKRNMDLIRRIALATTDIADDKVLSELPGVTEAEFATHVQWMHEAGLVFASITPKDSMRPAQNAVVWRLTWEGCEFADAVRSDTLWEKAKAKVLIPSGSWTFSVLLDWLKAEINNSFPIIGL